ncbi:hypothetical protein [Flavobacterium phragmitis]|uniref:Uncharacterized protein n=1 Tax=Flavobacterium phragmitis TaxID=739143 RepID=A0A1I1JST5_9FLAO|nr:hypothetical protein [Flavobacterium phragmitis]SFC51634.1 hypothetical protein SAMN05216297_10195 [Flavobacterium phragmitis]
MAELYIKVQGLYSWNEGKYSVEPIDFNKLIENSERILSTDFMDVDTKSITYYSIDEISCRLGIPWELLTLFNGINKEQKFSKLFLEDMDDLTSKVISGKSEFDAFTIPELFDVNEVKIFPYWMYYYDPPIGVRVNGYNSNVPPNDEEKIDRSVFERNELSINPILLESFLNRITDRIIPLNIFSNKDKIVAFIDKALAYCEFAKIYHIRILYDSGM